MTKAMAAESASARAMTIQDRPLARCSPWPRSRRGRRGSRPRSSRASAGAGGLETASSAGMTSPMYAVREALRPWSPLAWRTRLGARERDGLVGGARGRRWRRPTSRSSALTARGSATCGLMLAQLAEHLGLALADAPGDDVLVLQVAVVDVEMAHHLVRVGLRVEAERRDERRAPRAAWPCEEEVEERSSERLALTPTRPTTSSAAARIAKAAARRAPRGTRRSGFTPE